MIVPRTPTPPPLEDLSSESVGPEQIKEMQRQLKELKVHQSHQQSWKTLLI